MILDALDETITDYDVRSDLMDAFKGLIRESRNLKILISSRRDDDIKLQFEKEANIGIAAADVRSDISRFIEERIDRAGKRRRVPISQNLGDQLKEIILQKSNGM